MTGVDDSRDSDACPFASCPDFTGCDCDCNLPMPKSLWGKIKRCLAPWCVSGCCGCGILPCKRFSAWKRECAEKEEHGAR